MFDRRLLGLVPGAGRLVALNVALQWVGLIATIALFILIGSFLQAVLDGTADARGALALAGAAAVAVLMSVTAVGTGGGYDAKELQARWTDEKLSMTPGQAVPIERDSLHIPEELEEGAGLRETLLSCGLSVPAAPRWMPEGFEQDSLVVDSESMIESAMFSALYSWGDKRLCVFLLAYFEESGGTSTYQKDAGDPIPYEAGGVTHLLFTNAGRASAVWINGPVEGAISGDISMEDLMKMIDSIYEED